ncbi:MAG: N-formylglutamate amidohydrolase, partial [Hyphomicrobiaceae bacterium]
MTPQVPRDVSGIEMMFDDVMTPEREMILRELAPGFTIRQAEGVPSPFVFSSPHSGRTYPASFLASSRLTPETIRRSEDGFVDDLFANVTAFGAPLIAVRFPRAYLDLNREPFELDPLLFREPVPEFANTNSVRVISGLGTLARVVADNEAIYHQPLPISVALDRISLLYKPFHTALTELLAQRRRAFGHA